MKLSSKQEQQIKDLLRKQSIEEVEAATGISPYHIKRIHKEMRASGDLPMPEDLSIKIADDREDRKQKNEVKELREKYDHLLKKNEDLEQKLELAAHLEGNFKPAVIKVDTATTGGQATVVALASDWHVEQRVDPRTVNYLNEYNPDIAERRAKNFFNNLLKLVKKERQDVAIKNLVLWIGGDLVSGSIHDELIETNYMSPFQAAEFAQNLLAGGLKVLADRGKFEKITVVCSTGNHGRVTKKVHHGSETDNSYEHFIYWQLRKRFTDPIFDWRVAEGYFTYVDIYDKLYRFHHGHSVKYGGGQGGVTIPLTKFVHRANQQRYAAHDFIGHFHQLFRHSDFTINGSLVGFDSYALSIGARPERPQQAFQLIDSKRHFTVSAPILVED